MAQKIPTMNVEDCPCGHKYKKVGPFTDRSGKHMIVEICDGPIQCRRIVDPYKFIKTITTFTQKMHELRAENARLRAEIEEYKAGYELMSIARNSKTTNSEPARDT
jgi:hypothetical protein